MGKAVKSVTSAVSNAVSTVGHGVEKIAQGKVGEGLGDISQTAVRTGLDSVTGGNKGLVDSLSGGALTAAEGAARGNSTDIVRLGATAGATALAGPGGGLAANAAFAAGGNVFDAAATVATGMGAPSSLVSAGHQLGNNILGNGAPASPSSNVMQEAQPPIIMSAPTSSSSNTTLYIALGVGGVLILVVVLLISRKK